MLQAVASRYNHEANGIYPLPGCNIVRWRFPAESFLRNCAESKSDVENGGEKLTWRHLNFFPYEKRNAYDAILHARNGFETGLLLKGIMKRL